MREKYSCWNDDVTLVGVVSQDACRYQSYHPKGLTSQCAPDQGKEHGERAEPCNMCTILLYHM